MVSIKVVLADDHRLVREGLQAILEGAPDIDVVGLALEGRETIRLVKQQKPDIVVMDIAMPRLNGIDTTKRINGLGLSTRVLALSSDSSDQTVRDMLSAGASGFLPKDCAGDELVQAIRTVFDGQLFLSHSVANTVVDAYLSNEANVHGEPRPRLTVREREVLQLIAEGYSTAASADELALSVKTIETHRQKIMRKLKIRSIAGLTKYAIREGLTSV
ncbi:MAG: response regulator [Halioglobus sp.]